MDFAIRKQKGVTLVELLVVVAILAIMGGMTGVFLIKYLPEYHLRSAANNLSQDLKYTQVNALKTLTEWTIEFDEANHSYSIKDNSANTVKSVDLKSYPYEIRFTTPSIPDIIFTAEGFKKGVTNATFQIKNRQNSIITATITRTGSVRVTR